MRKIIQTRLADDNHQVLTVAGPGDRHRKTPCSDCPWRKDAVGIFPAEAFRLSADTAEDMAEKKFGCHQSASEKTATCAGFLLRGADHNLSVRLLAARGNLPEINDGGHDLFDDYFDMAVANGVDPTDPALSKIRRVRKP